MSLVIRCDAEGEEQPACESLGSKWGASMSRQLMPGWCGRSDGLAARGGSRRAPRRSRGAAGKNLRLQLRHRRRLAVCQRPRQGLEPRDTAMGGSPCLRPPNAQQATHCPATACAASRPSSTACSTESFLRHTFALYLLRHGLPLRLDEMPERETYASTRPPALRCTTAGGGAGAAD